MNFESCGGEGGVATSLSSAVEPGTRLRVGKDGWVDGWFWLVGLVGWVCGCQERMHEDKNMMKTGMVTTRLVTTRLADRY